MNTPLSHREQIGRMRLRSRRGRKIQDRLIAVAMIVSAWLTSAWALMIPVGIAHHSWWHVIPTMGFGTALAITFWPLAIGVAATILHEYFSGS